MNDNKPKIIKSISPLQCPHCNKDIFVAHYTSQSVVNWVLSSENLQQAKNDLKEKIQNDESIPDKEKTAVIKWIDDRETLFGPDDVDAIYDDLIKK